MSCTKALGHAVSLILPESLWHRYSILQVTMPAVATIHSVLIIGQHPGTELSCGMGPALQEKYLCIYEYLLSSLQQNTQQKLL